LGPVETVPSDHVVYVTSEELFGKPADLAKVAGLLREISRTAMTSVLCRFGVLYHSDNHDKWIALDRALLRGTFLHPELHARINAIDGESEAYARVAFSRPQALLALRLAQHLCHSGPDKDVISQAELRQIGFALLHVSDLLADPRDAKDNLPSDPIEGRKYLAAMMVSLFDHSNPPASPQSMKRTFEMLSSGQWHTDHTLRAAAEGFAAGVGLTIKQYVAFVAGLVAKFSNEEARGAQANTEVRLGNILEKARDRDGLRKAVELISIPFAKLPEVTPKPDQAISDRTDAPFRSAPLIGFPGDRYLCADLTFLTLRITSGLFWTIKPFLPKEGQVDLFRAWGDLFEEYVHDTLEPVIPKIYRRRPTDRDRNELTDALIDYGDDVVLVECKAALIPDSVKFGRDAEALVGALEEKLLKVDQIVRSIDRIFGRGARPEARSYIKKSFVQRLYPVIVSYDHAACSPFLEEFLNERLQQRLAEADLPKHPVVQPLTIMAGDDVELLVPLLRHGLKLPKMLRDRFEMGQPDVTFHNLLYAIAEKTKMPFRIGPNYMRVLKESLAYWKEQGLDGLSW
jgi:hypothetical protein